MQQNAEGQEHLRDSSYVLNGSNLIVHSHYGDYKHRLVNHVSKGVQVDQACIVYGNELYCESILFNEGSCRGKHALVLYSTYQDAPPT